MADIIMNGLDLARTPAQYPPPGVTPNLVDPYEKVWPARVLSVLFLVLAGAFLAARLFVKIRIVKRLQLEDCKYFQVNSPSLLTFIARLPGSWLGMWTQRKNAFRILTRMTDWIRHS